MPNDQPDWNAGSNTAVTDIIKGHAVGSSSHILAAFAGTSSVVVALIGRTVGLGILVNFVWYADFDTNDYTCQVFTSAMGTVDDLALLTIEMPSYGGAMQIVNYATDTFDFIVTSSNRVVTVPRLLSNVGPGFTFTAESDLVADTPLQLMTASVEGSTFFSNGATGIIATSDTDGVLGISYLGPDAIQYDLPLAAMVAGTPVYLTVALPQAGVWFTFTSPIDAAGPVITVLASPATP